MASPATATGRRAARAVAGVEEAEMGSADGGAAAVAKGVKAEMVWRGGGKAEAGGEKAEAGAGGKRRSSPQFANRAGLDEEMSGLAGELPRRKRKVITKCSKQKDDGVEVQNDMIQAQSPCAVHKGPEQVYDENENLRLQLALKTNELKQEENRRIKLELILKAKEIESLQKQNDELKAENEQLERMQSHKESQGDAGHVMSMSFMTTATAQRGNKLLVPLKKRTQRTLTNTARRQPVQRIPFASKHIDLLILGIRCVFCSW